MPLAELKVNWVKLLCCISISNTVVYDDFCFYIYRLGTQNLLWPVQPIIPFPVLNLMQSLCIAHLIRRKYKLSCDHWYSHYLATTGILTTFQANN